MVITTSAVLAAAAPDSANGTPAWVAASRACSERSKAATVCPALVRLTAIGNPMWPRPIKAILVTATPSRR
ncbi:Uncharacterised protein [Mycobacteroides abscessus subsp. abscessus]|nr:Uncharacterised protein [Mycobacteroides abscessus subsp. abscessus]